MLTNRIASLPRRNWRDNSEYIADYMTEMLRVPGGTMRLWPIQGVALYEIWLTGGLAGNIGVGEGKTLITGLAPVVLGSQRPMLLIPGGLRQKTIGDFEALREHFVVPHTIKIKSYQELGREEHANDIAAFMPDLLMCDEAQALRHVRKAACAKRVARAKRDEPNLKFIGLSGTLTKGDEIDYAHIMRWALGSGSPVPLDDTVLEEWSETLVSDGTRSFATLEPSLGGPITSVEQAREKFRDRVVSTPGVLISTGGFDGVDIEFRMHKVPEPPACVEHLDRLRSYQEAPDGWSLADMRFEVWGVERQLALGFCNVHDPRPPEPWFMARRAWCRQVLKTIETSDCYDSAKQVETAVLNGELDGAAYRAWKAIEPQHRPNSVPWWFDYSVIEWAYNWGIQEPQGSIVWCEHVPFAEKLQKLTGWDYYREGGLNARGDYIERADNTRPVIASFQANFTGRNLQHKFHRNLATALRGLEPDLEQWIGRTHRPGALRDVIVDALDIVPSHQECFRKAMAASQRIHQTTGQQRKMLQMKVL